MFLLKSLDRRLAMLRHHEFPSEVIRFVKELDVEGMSSEESVGEPNTKRHYLIKKLPWRNPTLTLWLHRVDGLPLKNRHGRTIPRRSER
jgi:hypothetical protein